MQLKLSHTIFLPLLFFCSIYTADNSAIQVRNNAINSALQRILAFSRCNQNIIQAVLDQHLKVHDAQVIQADEKKAEERKEG